LNLPRVLAACLLAAAFAQANPARADDLIWQVNHGEGGQSGSSQDNSMSGVDVIFFQHARSERQEFVIGAGYTDIQSDTAIDDHVRAVSLFPQLNLYGRERESVRPMFFVRALGPTWLSGRQLGSREQGSQFAFQAQVGAGLWFGPRKDWFAALSYKHFSNAGLFSPNDSFDVPVALTLGYRQKD
jgi:hypothetical protein